MPDTLENRTVLITGATGALGTTVAREFAQTRARLALTGRSEKKLEQLGTTLNLPSERILTAAADVTQAGSVESLVASIRDQFGSIDVLLNTAGGWSGGKPVGETSVEDWDHMLALNLHSAFLLARAVLPAMIEAGWGRIIFVSSKTAIAPRAKQAAYAVSKMGLITLAEVIAAESKGSGVTANALLPSIIDTPTNRQSMPKADPAKWVPPQRIAATMRFLCSDEAASISGAHIPIYGDL
jgi:NAD(P)-dependent dehydrogenase (short-subunit alcohol dehydrogenase family)